jgi:hypothetical protein
MKTLSKIGLLLGAAFLLNTAPAKAQWSWPSVEDALQGAKAAVAELQMATENLVIYDKKPEKIRADLMKRLDSAQAKLYEWAPPDTIYKAGMDVYKYMRKIYDLGRKGKISSADATMLQNDSIYTFNVIMYVYDNHPYWYN